MKRIKAALEDVRHGRAPWLLRWLIPFATVYVMYRRMCFLQAFPGLKRSPFILEFFTVMLVTRVAGIWPGIFATFLATAVCDYYFIPPINKFFFQSGDHGDAVETCLVLTESVFVCWLTNNLMTVINRLSKSTKHLADSKTHLEEQAALIDLTADALIVRDDDRIITWNRGAEATYGYSREAAVGQTIHSLLQTEFPTPLVELNAELVRNGSWTGELTHTTKDGRKITVMSHWALSDASPLGQRILETNTNISCRKVIEREMLHAKSAAESANAAKSQFLANMSHEIRTPLGALLGFTGLLRDPQLSEADRTSYLDIIERNGRALETLINDILDLSRVEAGKLKTVSDPFVLSEVLTCVIDLLSIKAREKGIRLDLVFARDVPHVICSDRNRLRQILVNVIGNAIKFTNKGSVHVAVELVIRNGDRVVRFAVSDTGCGIEPAAVDRLFHRFSQADNSLTRQVGGSGLGLALSRKLSQALQGNVWLERSQPGVGSVFFVEIDAGPEYQATAGTTLIGSDALSQPKRQSAQSLVGARILVAEDFPDNQRLISRILERGGAVVQVVDNGIDAVDAARSGEFDVILMDIQMPRLDGYGATAELRRLNYTKPIIALTAHAMREAQDSSKDDGFDDYLTKPLIAEQLLAKIATLSERNTL